MNFNIVTVPGDGIGPDIVNEAVKALNRVGEVYGHTFNFTEKMAGGIAIDTVGCPLPQDTIEACKKSDSVLLGAVGGPKWDHLGGNDRPEKALLGLRGELKLFANLRPVLLHKQLKSACPLKPEIIGDSLDILIVRELTSGIYFGKRGRNAEDNSAFDTLYYSVEEIERVLRIGFESAQKRNKHATIVDKANILETSRLWREVTYRVAKEYPDVEFDFLYVDNCSMQLIRNPHQFDVIITTNMFGDILSDEASMLTGSIGMLASASLGETTLGMYEPIHGSAPDIAGKDIANPIATILSIAMMLRFSFGLEKEALAVENAVTKILDENYRTGDIKSEGSKIVGTKEMGNLIVNAIK
ncbi:MAG: 3-isopropylmalate dehydrogenase [Clostridia bacterium]